MADELFLQRLFGLLRETHPEWDCCDFRNFTTFSFIREFPVTYIDGMRYWQWESVEQFIAECSASLV